MMRSPILLSGLAALAITFPVLSDPTVDVGGRIQIDGAMYDEDVAEFQSGTEFRRARLFAEGKISEDWEYRGEYDFADNDLSMKDVYVRYTGWSGYAVTIGQAKQPFGLEQLTSARYITFMERGLPDAFTTQRRIGVQLERGADNYTFAGALYGQEANETSGDEGVGVGGRIAFLPVHDEHRLVHLGVAAAYEEPSDTDEGLDSVRFRATPETHVASTRLVDTGDIPGVSNLTRIGLEAAGVFGPISVQGEYMTVGVDSEGGDFDFSGYYAYVSWFPGGETRPYKKGRFDRVQAEHAWELGLRFSSIDLNDGSVVGGEQDDITFGVNYYFNSHIRAQLEYVMADAEPAPGLSDEPNIVQARVAMDF